MADQEKRTFEHKPLVAGQLRLETAASPKGEKRSTAKVTRQGCSRRSCTAAAAVQLPPELRAQSEFCGTAEKPFLQPREVDLAFTPEVVQRLIARLEKV